jgi:hypothetical protein
MLISPLQPPKRLFYGGTDAAAAIFPEKMAHNSFIRIPSECFMRRFP